MLEDGDVDWLPILTEALGSAVKQKVDVCSRARRDWEAFSGSLQPWRLKWSWRTEKRHEQSDLKWPQQLIMVSSQHVCLKHKHTTHSAHTHTRQSASLAPTLFTRARAAPDRPGLSVSLVPTSSHTPGSPAVEHGGESEAGVTQHHRTGFLSPSSLDPVHLKIKALVFYSLQLLLIKACK